MSWRECCASECVPTFCSSASTFSITRLISALRHGANRTLGIQESSVLTRARAGGVQTRTDTDLPSRSCQLPTRASVRRKVCWFFDHSRQCIEKGLPPRTAVPCFRYVAARCRPSRPISRQTLFLMHSSMCWFGPCGVHLSHVRGSPSTLLSRSSSSYMRLRWRKPASGEQECVHRLNKSRLVTVCLNPQLAKSACRSHLSPLICTRVLICPACTLAHRENFCGLKLAASALASGMRAVLWKVHVRADMGDVGG